MDFSGRHVDEVTLVRMLCAALAAVVVIDAVSVGAPGLGLLAVPFVLGAVLFRHGSMAATVALSMSALLYAVLGVNYAIGAGFDAPWGDLLFAYAGTPLAVAIFGLTVRHRVHVTHQHA